MAARRLDKRAATGDLPTMPPREEPSVGESARGGRSALTMLRLTMVRLTMTRFSRRRSAFATLGFVVSVAFAHTACGDDETNGGPPPAPSASASGSGAGGDAGAGGSGGAGGSAGEGGQGGSAGAGGQGGSGGSWSGPPILTLRLVEGGNGFAFTTGELTYGEDVVPVNPMGYAVLELASNADFELNVTGANVPRHAIVGRAGLAPFQLVTNVMDRATIGKLLGIVQITPDPEKGLLVASLLTANFLPAVGAQASLDVPSQGPVVFTSTNVVKGNKIVPGGAPFVIFPNADPATAKLTVTGPGSSTCSVYPGPGTRDDYPVRADEVTSVVYVCK